MEDIKFKLNFTLITIEIKKMPDNYTSLTLKNVLLETGFEYENDQIVGTKTDLFTVDFKEGKFYNIRKENKDFEGLNAEGCLLLPSFVDWHTHLDKHFWGLPWQAKKAQNKTVKDMIAYEQKIIPELLKSSTARAQKLIDFLQLNGTGFARSHVNIDSTSKLDSLYNLQKALSAREEFFDWQLVAFPQHGLFYTDSAQYMKEAAQSDLIDFIGGLDPTSIDGHLEKSVDYTVQLALDYKKGIDMHLHENDENGVKTIRYLIDKVNENPELRGKTFISHAYVLAFLEKAKLYELAEDLAAAHIGIITDFPYTQFKMPVPDLLKKGVDLRVGTDNIYDHWSTFGTGNMLQKANLAAQLYGMETEFELSRALGFATGQTLPLDKNGHRQWPEKGDIGNAVLIKASCSAEAVSRLPQIKAMVHKGELVFAGF